MNQTVRAGRKSGTVAAPASKSFAHRWLIAAALGSRDTDILLDGYSDDILATVRCLTALGAEITCEAGRMHVVPVHKVPCGEIILPCGESGSTLRFMLPVVGVLGAACVFRMEGRLPERPLAPYDAELTRHGMTLRREGNLLHCSGKLCGGEYSLPGNVSSQYITGLLLSLPYADTDSALTVEGKTESLDYILMTEEVLAAGGASVQKTENGYRIVRGGLRLPGTVQVEGDWSNAAPALCMGALSEKGVTVTGMSADSRQGDRRVAEVLRQFGAEITFRDGSVTACGEKLRGTEIDAAQIPDLIPVLCAVGCLAEGETRVYNAGRLRLKESDRIRTTVAALTALGADIRECGDEIRIRGKEILAGGETDSFHDHRIAMAAAVAACGCAGDVTVRDSDCIAKSYPGFFDAIGKLEVL